MKNYLGDWYIGKVSVGQLDAISRFCFENEIIFPTLFIINFEEIKDKVSNNCYLAAYGTLIIKEWKIL